MAPLESRASSVSTTVPKEALEEWSDAIYMLAKGQPAEKMLSQDDLLGFGIVNDVKHLQAVINKLMDEGLLRPRRTSQGEFGWTWRTQEDASRYLSIPSREYRLMYEIIEDSGSDGIWTRSIRSRGGLTDSIHRQGLKWLENKGLIREFQSVAQPNKKMYILASLRPSQTATGGAWYTNGELDVDFLNVMQKIVFDYIKRESTYWPPSSTTATNTDGGVPAATTTKKPTKGYITAAQKENPHLLPMPAGYQGYPTALDITQYISEKKVTRDTSLTQVDIQRLIDLLVHRGNVEPIRLAGSRTGYRVCRPASIPASRDPKDDNDEVLGIAQAPYVSALSEMPCMGCPVADVCKPGGHVSPEECKYFQEWLGM